MRLHWPARPHGLLRVGVAVFKLGGGQWPRRHCLREIESWRANRALGREEGQWGGRELEARRSGGFLDFSSGKSVQDLPKDVCTRRRRVVLASVHQLEAHSGDTITLTRF